MSLSNSFWVTCSIGLGLGAIMFMLASALSPIHFARLAGHTDARTDNGKNGTSSWRDWFFIKKQHLAAIKTLWAHILPETAEDKRHMIILSVSITSCIIAGRIANLVLPQLLRWLLERLDKKSSDGFPMVLLISYVLLRYCGKDFLYFFEWTLTRRLENQVLDRISIAVYNKLMSLPAEYQDQKKSVQSWSWVKDSGSLVSRFASNMIFQTLPNILDLCLAIISFSTVTSAKTGAIMAVVLLAYVLTGLKTSYRSEEERRKLRSAVEAKDEHSSETVRNWWTVSSFGQIDREKLRYKQVVEHRRALDTLWCDNYYLDHNLKNLVMAIGLLWIYMNLSEDIWEQRRDKADLVMFVYLWTELILPIENIVRTDARFRAFVTEVEDLVEILSNTSMVEDTKDAVDFQHGSQPGQIVFQGITMSYDKSAKADSPKYALDDVSLSIQRGTTVAIIGRSGGGKSTFVKLLQRLYDANKGTIFIDGQDITRIRQASLSKLLGIVPQNIGAFSTTLMENVRYARPSATVAECRAACAAVCLEDMMDVEIGEDGRVLSGGQLQRLAIARALIHDPEILLLDEATSSLDSDTESIVLANLDKWQKEKGRTIIMIVHAFKSIYNRDSTHIIAMRDGKVIEQGLEAELLAKKGYYHALWLKQRLE